MAEHAATLDAEDVSAQQAEAGARAELLNESEFQDLYRLHARPLWAYLYRLTGSAADADDLLQEAFCRTARRAARDARRQPAPRVPVSRRHQRRHRSLAPRRARHAAHGAARG